MKNSNKSKNLTKKELYLAVCKLANLSQKEAKDIVQNILDSISNSLLKGQDVELRNFGVFELQRRKPRIGRNPNKPEQEVIIPDRIAIKFKPGKELKAELKKMDPSRMNAPKKMNSQKNALALAKKRSLKSKTLAK